MKKFMLILIASLEISFYLTAQSVGDYRSAGSGNWNDATKWEIYNGNAWTTSLTYPGQNSGTGAVTIMILHEIKPTATVPYPIASLLIDQSNYYTPEGNIISQIAVLTFSSENPVSLRVSGNVTIHGDLRINDQNGTKAHTLFVGAGLEVGTKIYDDCYGYEFIPAIFQTINQDDRLSVVFTGGYSWIDSGPNGITFQDVTFDGGGGFTVITPVYIMRKATFINGIVTPLTEAVAHSADCQIYYSYKGSINFNDNATVSGASNLSFVDGPVLKKGDDPFTFPIGSRNVYAPLTISAPGGQEASVTAMYVRADASTMGPISDPGLFNVSNCEYWDMGASQLNNSLDVTAGWSAASNCGSSPYITNVSEVTLAHFTYVGWNWDSHGGSGIGTTTDGSVTWNDVTVFGTFTLANLSVCNAPWGHATTISSNSATLSWAGISGAASYDVDYKPYTSGDWINAATATASTSLDLIALSPWMYYDWRIRTNCNISSSSYAQRQFQTLCAPPSGLITTNITDNSVTLGWSALSNWVSYNVQYKQSTSDTWIQAATGITSLSYPLGGLTAGVSYDWRVLVNCTVTIQGGYAQSSFTTLPQPPPSPVCNDVYENNNTSSQAKTISIGTMISAGISSPADVDWFKITTPNNNNTSLVVTINNLAADYDLYIYDKRLRLVNSSTVAGTTNEEVTFNSTTRKTTYYIKVIGKNGAYNTVQCYNLLVLVSSNATSASGKSVPANEVTGFSGKQSLYPNPASEFVHLRFNSTVEERVNVQIFNTAGQLIKISAIKITKGYNEVKIAVNDINQGIYLLRISTGELNMTKSL
jgi:hypothetical protein